MRRAKGLGYLVGSCSDRPVRHQQDMWERQQLAVDFTVLKHRLADVKARFRAAAYYHVGDTDTDEFFATAADFQFLRADVVAHGSSSLTLFGGSPGSRPA